MNLTQFGFSELPPWWALLLAAAPVLGLTAVGIWIGIRSWWQRRHAQPDYVLIPGTERLGCRYAVRRETIPSIPDLGRAIQTAIECIATNTQIWDRLRIESALKGQKFFVESAAMVIPEGSTTAEWGTYDHVNDVVIVGGTLAAVCRIICVVLLEKINGCCESDAERWASWGITAACSDFKLLFFGS
jgi:hypothetical protein